MRGHGPQGSSDGLLPSAKAPQGGSFDVMYEVDLRLVAARGAQFLGHLDRLQPLLKTTQPDVRQGKRDLSLPHAGQKCDQNQVIADGIVHRFPAHQAELGLDLSSSRPRTGVQWVARQDRLNLLIGGLQQSLLLLRVRLASARGKQRLTQVQVVDGSARIKITRR